MKGFCNIPSRAVLKNNIRTIKEIAAFMNTYGGIVLIGVSNDKRIIGIERDLKIQKLNPKRKDTREDKFLRSIGDMIDARLKIFKLKCMTNMVKLEY